MSLQKNMRIKKTIQQTAEYLGIDESSLEFLGQQKAKIKKLGKNKNSNLVLVTATNPTTFGEGKTTISIALNDALNLLNKKSCAALRQPSLGPVFGTKGGATGGGKSSIRNSEDVNLHFTGDFHAITSANNLIVSIIDNHIYQGNDLHLDKKNIFIKRCLDVNDRSLREIKIGNRKESFVITAASDIMATFCMSKSFEDLRVRLQNTIVAKKINGDFCLLEELDCVDAILILLKDAINPNLSSSLIGSPIIIHGGPFANIALGCSSVIGTRTALSYADYVVTEAGFGADLGAEKFLDIKSRLNSLPIRCVVLVTTVRSVKYNSTLDKTKSNKEKIKDGIKNLERHISNIKNVYNLPIVVALNTFPEDTSEEIHLLKSIFDENLNVHSSICEPFTKGGKGALDLAKKVLKVIEENENGTVRYAYALNSSLYEKLESVVKSVYHGEGLVFSKKAKIKLEEYTDSKYKHLPVCIAKTQYSFSDVPTLVGAPKNFKVKVKDIFLNSGAGFFVVTCGDIMTMPGLGKNSRYSRLKITTKGKIENLA